LGARFARIPRTKPKMRGLTLFMVASASALRMGGLARVRSPCMKIEPDIFRECAIYDFEMESKMERLEEVMNAAKDAAMAATAQMEQVSKEKATLEAALTEQEKKLEKLSLEVADEREETSYLRENLQKQAASAAASAAAASSLEIEVSRMLRQLDEQGVAAASQLKSETTSLRALLDDQSSAATKARSDADRAEKVKSELREEIDARIIEASEARKMAERLAADLEQSQEKSDDYLKAIEQIARVAATFTQTNTVTLND